MKTQRKLQAALELFQIGRLAEADLLAKQVLKLNPRSTDALHLRGVVAGLYERHTEAEAFLALAASLDESNHFILFNLAKSLSEQDKHAEALSWHRKALRLNSVHDKAWLGFGQSLFKLGDFDTAISAFNSAIAINTALAEAYSSKGNCLQAKGSLEDAIALHDLAIGLNPNLAEAWSNRGVALTEFRRYGEALNSLDRAIELDPKLAAAWGNRGSVLCDLLRHKEALESYDNAIRLRPKYVKAWSNRGNVLRQVRRCEEALACYDRAIELEPIYAEAWSNRGNVLRDLYRLEEAMSSFDRAIALKPDYAEAWSNRGATLNDLGHHEESLISCDRAIQLNPDCVEAWSNRGVALNDLQRHEEAMLSYDRAIALQPEHVEAAHNTGLLELSRKFFLKGFESYLQRWRVRGAELSPIDVSFPPFDPNRSVKNLLLWAEQGVGDEIFYAGFLDKARDAFPQLSLAADIRLHPILARSYPWLPLVNRSDLSELRFDGSFDCQAPIGNLGYMLGLGYDELKGSRKPFFVADSKRTEVFRSHPPFTKGRVVCGLSWGSRNRSFGKEKSVELSQMAPILRNARMEFVNLQYGEVQGELQAVERDLGVKIHQARDLDCYNDIDGLLSLINACDIVITTSNVTAHLVGASGKRGCVLVPFSRGRIWYWHMNDPFSFWYPSLKLFYQTDRQSWSDVVCQVQAWIKEEV